MHELLQANRRLLLLSTEAQLRLVLERETPLDHVLERYHHVCGPDVIESVRITAWSVFREAGRIASRMLVHDVPGAYLTALNEDAVNKVIHDYQNRLLNMRLQHELLHRMYGVPSAVPPVPLPGQHEPSSLRVQAIIDQLDWWTGQYCELMEKTEQEMPLSRL